VDQPNCPLATSLTSVIEFFSPIFSCDEVHLEVRTERRTFSGVAASQEVLGSLLGLIIPASGCPHTVFFRPMARFHLPLSDEQETIYRAVGNYLLAQYFRHRQGLEADLDLRGLAEVYDNMKTLNESIARRIRAAIAADAAVNAVVLLDTFTYFVPFAIEASLEELRSFFEPFLADRPRHAPPVPAEA
jgi:hypothetical protein